MRLQQWMTVISACAALTACGPEMEGEPGSEVTEAGEGATGEAAQELSRPCGAYFVTGLIEQRYKVLGGRNVVGCPITDERRTPSGRLQPLRLAQRQRAELDLLLGRNGCEVDPR